MKNTRFENDFINKFKIGILKKSLDWTNKKGCFHIYRLFIVKRKKKTSTKFSHLLKGVKIQN